MFKGKSKLLNDLYLLLFEGHLWKYSGVICATTFTPKQPGLFNSSDGHRILMGGDTGCYNAGMLSCSSLPSLPAGTPHLMLQNK
jgi:hypothetical protein